MKRASEDVDAARAAGNKGVDYDPFDSVVGTQIRLGRHIASDHAEDLPEADPSCEKCMSDVASRTPEPFILEHRARHVFAPPRIVGLL
ncbi:hypothetical protein ACFVT5_08895 [Streptomyces sp. NPDC058001]|uniref:hypothetical protein n=1 Tax=Streptomyces sp. NPDC058001 TaxID=3346300 RepID=UPI0036E0B504